jgi:hypothetical protein
MCPQRAEEEEVSRCPDNRYTSVYILECVLREQSRRSTMKRVYRSGKATSLPPHLQVRQYGAESKMAPGKQLAVLGHGDGQVDSARRYGFKVVITF